MVVADGGAVAEIHDAAEAAAYACADPDWMQTVLSGFGVQDLLAALAEIGAPAVKHYPDAYRWGAMQRHYLSAVI